MSSGEDPTEQRDEMDEKQGEQSLDRGQSQNEVRPTIQESNFPLGVLAEQLQ